MSVPTTDSVDSGVAARVSRSFDGFGVLLGLVVVTIAALGLIDLYPADTARGMDGRLVALMTLLTGTMLVLALRAARARTRVVRLALIIAIVTTAAIAISGVADPDAFFGRLLSFSWFLLIGFTPLIVLARLLEHRTVTSQTILGVICVYLLLAVTFTYLFLAIDGNSDRMFFGSPQPSTAFMYFSLVTIATLGYGDLTAVENLGRMLSSTEGVLGQLFLVTVVARLVGLYSGPDMTRLAESRRRRTMEWRRSGEGSDQGDSTDT